MVELLLNHRVGLGEDFLEPGSRGELAASCYLWCLEVDLLVPARKLPRSNRVVASVQGIDGRDHLGIRSIHEFGREWRVQMDHYLPGGIRSRGRGWLGKGRDRCEDLGV